MLAHLAVKLQLVPYPLGALRPVEMHLAPTSCFWRCKGFEATITSYPLTLKQRLAASSSLARLVKLEPDCERDLPSTLSLPPPLYVDAAPMTVANL